MQVDKPRSHWKFWLLISLLGVSVASYAAVPETNTRTTTKTALKAHSKTTASRSITKRRQPLTDGPGIKSTAALVIDSSDSSVLYSRQPDEAAPIASITKLMTALVVEEAGQPGDEVLEVTRDDRSLDKGSASRIEVGSRLKRDDLLHVALMSSDNRAAHAVARNYPGGLAAMVKAMNAKARALGMKDSRFVEPTGLSAENVASPKDLARLVNAAAQNPTIRKFSTDQSYTLVVGRRTIEFRNTNSLVRNADWDILVQKTGYTNEAGRCLVMKTVIQGRPLVIVLLDSFGKNTRVADARRIRKWIETRVDMPVRTAAVEAREGTRR